MSTFVRIRRDRAPCGSGGSWSTDTPDSDLNLSFRLQQLTSMKVDPNGRFLRLTDPELFDYPFRRFSEKIAYPLAINVIFYVMTH